MGIRFAGIPQTNYEFHSLRFHMNSVTDIMADSADTKQMLLTMDSKAWLAKWLIFASI
jgi:hypothetical protein